MEFRENQAIYLQIAELICERILLKQWASEDKVPSVRELAVQLEVNPNTVMRTYDFLEQKGIIFTKRGMGFFVSTDAHDKVTEFRREEFLQNELPQFFKAIHLLGIDFSELQNRFETFKTENY